MKRWYTCAPSDFPTPESFFRRDSGLLCRGLQALGYDSKVVLPERTGEPERAEVLRAKRHDMESADWWRSLRLDGVIMVGWARHRDTPMARAIAASGTRLVSHVDGAGNAFPLLDQTDLIQTYWRQERGTGAAWVRRLAQFIKKIFPYAVKQLLRHSYLKYRHLQQASLVTLQTPVSLERTRRFCALFGGKRHGIHLLLAGYPIPPDCQRDPAVPKEQRVIAIGRWEDLCQKRANVLMHVCAEFAARRQQVHVDIFGTKTDALTRWHAALPANAAARIHVHGVQPGDVVARAIQKAQVSFFPSAHEGGPQALFECLACGVTTVGLDTDDLPGTRWAAAAGHGTLARHDTTTAYVEALETELAKWERGEYSPEKISEMWSPYTNCQAVLKRMLCQFEDA